jgi:acyl phosphate:glycerol-3-phosphate acyltransferase
MLHPINWQLALPYYAAALAFGYLLGTIPFGLLLTRLAGTQDIRQIGSGNIGATNVLRTGRKGLAAATLLLDMLKGTAAVLIAYHFFGQDLAVLAGIGAFLGHLFSLWLGFKGGKGVATYIGVLLGLAWPMAFAFGAVWILVAAVTRYSSLSALVASAATPVLLWLNGDRQEAQVFGLLTVLLVLKHAPNVVRLARGTEGKIGQKTAPAGDTAAGDRPT